jgi:hypothetical protein
MHHNQKLRFNARTNQDQPILIGGTIRIINQNMHRVIKAGASFCKRHPMLLLIGLCFDGILLKFQRSPSCKAKTRIAYIIIL